MHWSPFLGICRNHCQPVPGPVCVDGTVPAHSCSRVCVHAPSFPKDKIFPIMVCSTAEATADLGCVVRAPLGCAKAKHSVPETFLSTKEQEWALIPKPFHFLIINHILWLLTQVIYRICRSRDCWGCWPWQQKDGAALAGARSVVQTMPLVCLPEFPTVTLSQLPWETENAADSYRHWWPTPGAQAGV